MLQKIAAIHDKKNEDYANEADPFSNFRFTAQLVDLFTDPIDRVFALFIGTKLMRLAELSKGKTPKNEAIEDTELDLATYATIWAAMKMEQRESTQRKSDLSDALSANLPDPIQLDQLQRAARAGQTQRDLETIQERALALQTAAYLDVEKMIAAGFPRQNRDGAELGAPVSPSDRLPPGD